PSWSGSRTSTSHGDPAPSEASRRRSLLDEHHELGLCRFPRKPNAFDPLQDLGRRQLRNSLRRC
ncbi:MAG TPA: hypothetical protein VH642_15700, partial [Streptosporangiaceae bacterium]